MNRATTLQFRAAVRKAMAKLDVRVLDSWTNGAPRGRYTAETGVRWVGMQIQQSVTPPKKLVKAVEKILNKQGVTADTRYSDATLENSFGYGGCYLRGTCDYRV